MARAAAWFEKNDMRIRLEGLRSSTMAAGTYLNNSGGVTYEVWRRKSTEYLADRVNTGTLVYEVASNGNYQTIVQSSDHSMSTGTAGKVVVRVQHGTLTGRWEPSFLVQNRY